MPVWSRINVPCIGSRLETIRRAAPLAIVVASLLAGCAGPKRPTLTDAQLQERSAEATALMQSTFHDAVTKILERARQRPPQADGSPAELHFLAISGGGDKGAFGAGFLVGWGQAEDPRWRRPDFDTVTGVSTGALLAPYAFVGTDEACLTVEEFYRNPKRDWLRSRGWLFFLPSNASFATIPGLERDIRGAIDKKFIAQLAEQSRKGKLLVISATDLDLGRQRFWEVGREAELAEQTGDFDRIQRIMLSSAAIPGAFPPVSIDDSLYGDGGVTANVFLRLDTRNPSAFLPRWLEENPGKPLPKVRYWVIFNNQTEHRPKTVQARWPAVISPSLATATRSATLSELRWLAADADYVNLRYNADIEVRVVSIPNDWRPPIEGSFIQETMRSLSDLGRIMGADPKSWTLLAAPRGNAAQIAR